MIKSFKAKVMAVLAVSALAVFGLQAPALAASGTIYPPAGIGGSGYWTVDYTADKFALSVTPGNLAAGWCLTTYLDLSRVTDSGGDGTHYDINAARSCQAGGGRSSSWQYDGDTYGININTINKLSICYAPLNVTPTAANCNHIIGSLSGVDHSFNSNKTCSRAWTKAANGDNFYFSGGSRTECGS
jgi:hypothetical protein